MNVRRPAPQFGAEHAANAFLPQLRQEAGDSNAAGLEARLQSVEQTLASAPAVGPSPLAPG